MALLVDKGVKYDLCTKNGMILLTEKGELNYGVFNGKMVCRYIRFTKRNYDSSIFRIKKRRRL